MLWFRGLVPRNVVKWRGEDLTYFAIMVWVGGAVSLTDQAGAFKAAFWPIYLGRYLAKIAMRDYFDATSERSDP